MQAERARLKRLQRLERVRAIAKQALTNAFSEVFASYDWTLPPLETQLATGGIK